MATGPGTGFLFELTPGFDRNLYDELRNDLESGYGMGMVLYDAPGNVTGGAQVNIDASSRTISPEVIVEAVRNPMWLIVILTIVLIYFTAKKK